jgi:hypothetical protein
MEVTTKRFPTLLNVTVEIGFDEADEEPGIHCFCPKQQVIANL